ncbi:MAG TPA: ABC transporter permease subunit [Steroidobacteraceae bacterium]|nr:ABC transporter permease subunit [Steroidobacteraceae bacterium]
MRLTGRFLHLAMGCAVLLLGWEVIGRAGLLGKTFPSLSAVLRVYADAPRWALLVRSSAATLASVAAGYAVGISLGAAVALLAHLVPSLRGGLDRLAVLVNALPVIALGPVLIITAGRESTPAALAAVPVFFLLYTSTRVGLRGASPRLELVLTTLGASRRQRLTKLEAIAAVPSVFRGMKIAASSAMIGAIVGEWFGAPSGLGVVVLNSMQNFQIPLLWATVIVIAAITLSAYGLLTLAERAARRRIGECDG